MMATATTCCSAPEMVPSWSHSATRVFRCWRQPAEDYGRCARVQWYGQIDSLLLDPAAHDDSEPHTQVCIKTTEGRIGMLTITDGRNLNTADNSFEFSFVLWNAPG
jgi:hypothetical protein